MSLLTRMFAAWSLIALSLSAATITNTPSTPVPGRTGPFAWHTTVLEVAAEPMAKHVNFAFPVTNTSDQVAFIVGIQTSCECTVADLPSKPWRLEPGEGGILQVRMNVVGRFGKVTKVVTVETSHGIQELLVTSRIPITPAPFNVSARKMDLEAARKDPQTVFQGKCAACHSLPTVGRHGKDLFTKACAICHIAEHRAEMVPDLAQLGGKRNADYWRNLIVNGKPGTLMPAFSRGKNGPLEPDQVDSLVEYLLQAYPGSSSDAP